MPSSVGVRVGLAGAGLVGLAVALLLLASMPVPEPVASAGPVRVEVPGGGPVPVSVYELAGEAAAAASMMLLRVNSSAPLTIVAGDRVYTVEGSATLSAPAVPTIYLSCGGCTVELVVELYRYTRPYSWLTLPAIIIGLAGVAAGFAGTVVAWLEAPWVKRRRRGGG